MNKPEFTLDQLIEMQRRDREAQAELEKSQRDLEEAKQAKGK